MCASCPVVLIYFGGHGHKTKDIDIHIHTGDNARDTRALAPRDACHIPQTWFSDWLSLENLRVHVAKYCIILWSRTVGNVVGHALPSTASPHQSADFGNLVAGLKESERALWLRARRSMTQRAFCGRHEGLTTRVRPRKSSSTRRWQPLRGMVSKTRSEPFVPSQCPHSVPKMSRQSGRDCTAGIRWGIVLIEAYPVLRSIVPFVLATVIIHDL